MRSNATSRASVRENSGLNQQKVTDEQSLIGPPSGSDAAELSVRESLKRIAHALWKRRGREDYDEDPNDKSPYSIYLTNAEISDFMDELQLLTHHVSAKVLHDLQRQRQLIKTEGGHRYSD